MSRQINIMLKEMGLIDVWRAFHQGQRDYTYYSYPHTSYSRIDHFLAFGRDKFRIMDCDLGLIDISDHALISLTFNKFREQTKKHSLEITLWHPE